jgi:hypothetical protein
MVVLGLLNVANEYEIRIPFKEIVTSLKKLCISYAIRGQVCTDFRFTAEK